MKIFILKIMHFADIKFLNSFFCTLTFFPGILTFITQKNKIFYDILRQSNKAKTLKSTVNNCLLHFPDLRPAQLTLISTIKKALKDEKIKRKCTLMFPVIKNPTIKNNLISLSKPNTQKNNQESPSL